MLHRFNREIVNTVDTVLDVRPSQTSCPAACSGTSPR
jgi:hypothetical protein